MNNPHDCQDPSNQLRTGGVPINRLAAHLHMIYILDISGSMEGRRIKIVVDCLNKTLCDIRKRADISGACDVTVITFNENASLLQAAAPLDQVSDFSVNEFVCEGGTNGWSGLDLALRQYQERRDEYHCYGFMHYPAQIMYISDGNNNVGSDTNNVIDQFLALQQPRGSCGIPRVNFVPIGFGENVDLDFLRSLNVRGEAALANDAADLAGIFEYLTSSILAIWMMS